MMRSFDERSHNYQGYSLVITGLIDSSEREFSVGIGKAAQQKYQFKAGSSALKTQKPRCLAD